MTYITDIDGDRILLTPDTLNPKLTLVSVWEKPKHSSEQIAGVILGKDDLIDLALIILKRVKEIQDGSST